eukprot:111458-Prymnesium_polylepis.1
MQDASRLAIGRCRRCRPPTRRRASSTAGFSASCVTGALACSSADTTAGTAAGPCAASTSAGRSVRRATWTGSRTCSGAARRRWRKPSRATA